MKVGSLVECYQDAMGCMARLASVGNEIPKIGETYTVRAIKDVYGNVNILTEEIINQPLEYDDETCECCFLIENFRELQPPMDLTELLKETEPQTILITQ